VRRIRVCHSIAFFPFVEGQPGRQFEYATAEERAAVVTILAELHQATSSVDSVARRIDLDLPGRGYLEAGLQEVNRAWSGGPFSEPSRQALARHAADLAELLVLFDRLSRDVARPSIQWVVPQGAPHAVHVIGTEVRDALLSCGRVAPAP